MSRGVLRVYETVVYADDVAATADFYAGALGLRRIDPPDEGSAAFRLEDGGVLLLFDARRTSVPGRYVPPHGATGPGHLAFAVGEGELDPFAARLRDAGLEIEREITWPAGGRSLY